MQDEKLKATLKTAYDHAAPDVLASVLKDCKDEKGKVLIMENNRKNNKKSFRSVASIAACLLLLCCGTLGAAVYNANFAVASTVSLDVNPSIELTVNQKERVLEVLPLNEDGKMVIGDMDFKGSDIDVAVNALIGSMLRNGYLSEIANSILISVSDEDGAKAKALQDRLAAEVNALLQTDSFSGAVLSQTLSADPALTETAARYDITEGKAKLINEIIAANPRHTFDELAKLNINQLNLIMTTAAADTATDTAEVVYEVDSLGSASEAAYIGRDRAIAAALEAAGIKEADVQYYRAEMDVDNGRMEYEVEFVCDGVEYEYDIDAATGTILEKDAEDAEREYRQDKPTDRPAQPSGEKQPDTKPTEKDHQAPQSGGSYIGSDAAKKKALSHAGFSAGDVRDMECELDRERGKMVYEVSFNAGQHEYDYDIDAVTGEILKSHKEIDN